MKNILLTSISVAFSFGAMSDMAMADVSFGSNNHVFVCGVSCYSSQGTRVNGGWTYGDTQAVANGSVSFENSTPYDNGMAMFNWGGAVTYNGDATFKNNSTIPDFYGFNPVGSTIYTYDGGQTTFNGDVLFESNGSRYDGGGMNTVNASTAFNKKATFKDNTALRNGGAIGHTSGNLIFAGDVDFTGNKAVGTDAYGNPSGGDGGAIFSNVISYADYQIRNKQGNIVVASRDILPGGQEQERMSSIEQGWSDPYSVEIIGTSRIDSNVQFKGASSFKENTAGSNGGALAGRASSFIFDGAALFDSNNAGANPANGGGDGGAISLTALTLKYGDGKADRFQSTATFNQAATFTGNKAQRNGGAVSVTESTVIFNGNSLFQGNTAEDAGGAIFSNAGNVELNGKVLFKDNEAQRGGAIYMANSQLTLDQNAQDKITFSDNKASDLGDDIYLEKSALRVKGDYDLTFAGTVYGEYAENQDDLIDGYHFVKEGSGQLFMRGQQNSTGNSQIRTGSVQAWADNNRVDFEASNFNINAGASLVVNRGTIGGDVANAGTFQLRSSQLGAADYQITGNFANNGTINMANGNPADKLTIDGNYIGSNGLTILDTYLGSDQSATDKLVVGGNTTGRSTVKVINVGGPGAQTNEGIELITVGGASEGIFTLVGDYIAENGNQAVVGGTAYAYQLYKGNRTGSETKNWYLRSELKPVDPVDPVKPLYQPGVPTYEAYPQALLGLNGLNTLQQRVGNRFWVGAGNRMISEGADAIVPYAPVEEVGVYVDGNGVWGRIEGAYNHIEPRFSTSDTDFNQNVFKMQAGVDGLLTETENGTIIGGVFTQYAHGKSKTYSIYGDGEISTDGYGVGGTLTWYGNEGFYVDGQAQVTWYNSDLSSVLARRGLVDGNDGIGYALSIESGKRFAIDPEWSVTPQAQLVYSSIDFDDFTDTFGASVSLDKGDSLQGRLGITLDHENSWQNASGTTNRAHVYGIANLYYEFLEGTKVDVAGISFASEKERLWGGVGVGGTYNWNDDKYSIYGESLINTSLSNFGDSYSLKGTVGFRMKW